MFTAMQESFLASIAKPAPLRENHTRGARASRTPGSSRTASGNAWQAKAPSFSSSNNLENLEAFDGEGNSVASAEAKCGDAALQIAALLFVEQRDEDERARSTNGVAEGNSAALNVHIFWIEV